MPKFRCPECGELVSFNSVKRLCPRKISFTDAQRGGMRHYDRKRANLEESIFDKVYNWIQTQQPNHIFIKSNILDDLGITDITSGDDVNKVLDFFICLGTIERIEHNVTTPITDEGGNEHKHRILPGIRQDCSFFSRDKKGLFICSCPENEFELSLIKEKGVEDDTSG